MLESDVDLFEAEVGGNQYSVYYTIVTDIGDGTVELAGEVVKCPWCGSVFQEGSWDAHHIEIKEVIKGYENVDFSCGGFSKQKKSIIKQLRKEIDERYHLCETCDLKREQEVRDIPPEY